MSSPKIAALAMILLLLVYIVLLANTGISLLATDILIGQIMGFLILVFPILALWVIFVELRFGLAAQKLVARVEQQGTWPDLGIETRPSGRAVRASADAAFPRHAAHADANPQDWHAWFTLSLAYDACGDRKRARSAMRKAIALSA
ncbi:unannotated protein [freshwater metagenome]|uniref:Unannotated protein n=1 Tax=freshwater metagenome TaxID=449393 RepID=A0A6J6JH06_9ZZZZ|nr:hypothetical protein [Actinomycetota bacterium]